MLEGNLPAPYLSSSKCSSFKKSELMYKIKVQGNTKVDLIYNRITLLNKVIYGRYIYPFIELWIERRIITV